MADDLSGVIKADKVLTETEDEKVSIPYNHQIAPTSTRLSIDSAEAFGNEGTSKLQQAVFQRSVSCDAVSAVSASVDSLSKPFEAPFGLDRIVPPSAAKRARGRPRKDFPRPSKRHIAPAVSSKVMRGRGRPRRDDNLHHKIFPGRPRFRGKKFYFPMSHASHKIQDAQLNKDLYEDVSSNLKSGSTIQEKILPPSNIIPDNELKIEHCCVLCNLSESSVLGQGKLTHFQPSKNFNCFESMEQRAQSVEKNVEVSSESGSEFKLLFKKQKSLESSSENLKIQRSKSLQSLSGKSSMINDLFHELEATGFKTSPASNEIFEPTGALHAHFNCAAWSVGVTKTFEKELYNVDKAVVTAAFQRCSKCDRYGASVKCCTSECTRIYHYPCAIVSGALQNANSFKIICSVHRELAFSFGVLCMACHGSGDLSQLLLCTSCANYYHGNCLEPAITPSPDVRAGWQCSDCKVCQNCRHPEDSSKMLVCNTCDKGYHAFCVKPPVASIPKSGWKCSACRMCGDCGARTPGNGPSSRWHLNYSVCDSCYQQRNKGVACPLCGKAYRQCSQRKGMRHCIICQKYIHPECDRRTGMNSMNYVCPLCTNNDGRHLDESYVEHHIKDTYQGSSRDSFLSGNEDTLSSEESDGYIEAPCSKVSSRRTSSEQQPKRKKRASKPKFKSYAVPDEIFYPMSAFLPKEYKTEDDDPSDDNKMVLASATDEFVLCQDLCVMCGSFGKGEEGRLIACAQCGQCYHSYCASIKVTTVVLKKGWRCLDCTVCEGCGQPHDEGRLLLCDECDISFHTYCLNPPLPDVPPGNWKCKWCVMCTKCGSKSPGLNCEWQVNYTLCGPCASFTVCCLCLQHYVENDLIINCNRCERWLHGMCDQIENEDQAEKCAEYGYTCPHCRPPDELPPHLLLSIWCRNITGNANFLLRKQVRTRINMATDENVNKLQRKRSTLRSEVTRLTGKLNNEDGIDKAFDVELLEDTLQDLKLMNETIHDLLNDEDYERDTVDCEKYFDTAKLAIFNTKRKVIANINVSSSEFSSSSSINTSVKLPTIKINTFFGGIEEFPSFWERFNSCIDSNASLSLVDKHVFLRGYLDGEAKRLVDGISVIGDTYETTKKLLEDKYGNKDRIIQSHLDYLEYLKPVQDPSPMELNDLYIECNRRLQALNALGENTEAYGRILAQKIIRSFPTEICCRWIIYAKREKLAEGNITRLMQFLAEEVEGSVEAQKIRGHWPQNCETVTDYKTRVQKLKNSNRCFLCTNRGHRITNCPRKSTARCIKCKKQHHVSICPPRNTQLLITNSEVNHINIPRTIFTHLQTACLYVTGPTGITKLTRCILDGGSQASFVDVKLIDKLKLNVINSSSLRVQAFESSFTQEQRRCVQLTLSGLWSKQSILITAFESNNSYTAHPAATLEISQFAHKNKLKLADPPDNSSLPIELLIAGDYYWQIVTAESPIKLSDSFVMVPSMLGWILSGSRTHTTIVDNTLFISFLCKFPMIV
ncbi:hypothetical protein NPIL_626702 [Nephila pilipes]|uniref:Histone-lysine N-methyltransferase n=1 Tax=Nephila pilipes TaxID=299642 RepID=A0A8X6QNR2_NEPPI|nr:hypothetical protein NPIL_626702 [Nephila pilipes]